MAEGDRPTLRRSRSERALDGLWPVTISDARLALNGLQLGTLIRKLDVRASVRWVA